MLISEDAALGDLDFVGEAEGGLLDVAETGESSENLEGEAPAVRIGVVAF